MKVALSNGTHMEVPDTMTAAEAEFLRLHEELHIAFHKLPRPQNLYADERTAEVLRKMGLM